MDTELQRLTREITVANQVVMELDRESRAERKKAARLEEALAAAELWREKAEAALDDECKRRACLERIALRLIDYRRRNTLNFQLEKIDDFIHEFEAALEGTQHEHNRQTE